MLDLREKFRELTRVFDPIYQPRPAAGDGPGASYVRETHEDYRRQLDASLDLNDNAKLLVAGQPGCGKTTLLLSLADDLRRAGRVVAFVDLEAQTAVQDLDPVEMYLAAFAELLSEAGRRGVALSEPLRSATAEWLLECQVDLEQPPRTDGLAASLFGLLRLGRHDPRVREEVRRLMMLGGDNDPCVLLARALQEFAAQRPVLILDGLDKLPPARASQTFLDDKRKPMAELPGAAILTIPLSVVYEPTFNVLSERYNNADSAVLPAVRLWDLTGERKRVPSGRGIAILQRIIAARVDPIDPQIIMPDAVERAIVGSGGNIRELARLLQASVIKAFVRKGNFIECQDIEAAIADQRESFRRAYNPKFFTLLQRVRTEYRLDDSSDVAKQLLYGLWVTEYRNGSAWYSLPEPVEQLLRQMERVTG
jgi:energy-coupling factor transporter ATP-binding protein EcfA2